MEIFDARQGDHFGPIFSLLAVTLILLPPCVWLIVIALRGILANRRLAADCDRPDGHYVPRAGHIAVRGVVVVLDAKSYAMRVEIDLAGTEWTVKNGKNHKWAESGRRILCNGFAVRTDSGQLIDVQASSSTLLVDKLDQLKVQSRTSRTKTAELSPGERVYVVGELQKVATPVGEFVDFREPPAPKWTILAVLLSTEPIEKKYWERVSFYVRWLMFSMLAVGIVQGFIAGPYYLRAYRGVHQSGSITTKRQYVTGSGKNRTTHRVLDLHIGDDLDVRTEEAGDYTYDLANRGDSVPVIVVPGYPSLTQIGAHPTINMFATFGGGIFIWVFIAIFSDRRRKTRPWYWQHKLEMTGVGPLPPLIAGTV